MRLPDGIDAVLAAREIQPIDRLPGPDLDRDVPEVSNGDWDDLAKGQGNDRQIVSAHAESRSADHDAESRGDDGAQPDHFPEAPLESHERGVEYAHGVGADGKERRIAEVKETGVADHDVQSE